jgi:hypothetical protein
MPALHAVHNGAFMPALFMLALFMLALFHAEHASYSLSSGLVLVLSSAVPLCPSRVCPIAPT